MDEKKASREIELDVGRIMKALLRRAWLIVIISVVTAAVVLIWTMLFVTPKYQASVMLYVNNSSISADGLLDQITSSDITASKGLVKNYIIILQTRETIREVIDYAEVDRTYGQVKGMISAESVDSTDIFRVTVTSTDPQEAAELANAVAHILPGRIEEIIKGTSSKVVSWAVVPSGPSAPSVTRNVLLGFLLAFLGSAAIVVLIDVFDATIRTEEDLTDTVKSPVLAAIPDMNAKARKGQYAYGKYGYRKRTAYSKEQPAAEQAILVGSGIEFSASEAYKMLRTKVQFSFADDETCHIIGVSSAMTGEGKSLTAVNLSYSMSQLGKRVLLIDCDMRRPSVAEKLPVKSAPGLSDYLSGQVRSDNLIQHCGLEDETCAFHVIASGRIPPNPMELLSSNKMERMLEALRANYDYIVLDLPPVGEVGDALATSKLTDGVLLIARQNHGNRLALGAAVRQFEFMKARILGVVLNCMNEDTAGYKRYYKRYGRYGKYHRGYYKGYGSYYRSNTYQNKAAEQKIGSEEQ